MTRTSLPNATSKPCQTCGQEIAFHRKWTRCWSRIHYCSDKCRRGVVGADDLEFEDAIFQLLRSAERGASIGPADVIRLVQAPETDASVNRILAAAFRMKARGIVDVAERGMPVDRQRATAGARFELTAVGW